MPHTKRHDKDNQQFKKNSPNVLLEPDNTLAGNSSATTDIIHKKASRQVWK